MKGNVNPVIENPGPLVVPEDTVTLELPLFDRVAVFELLFPTTMLPKESEVGDTFNTDVGVAPTVTVAEADLVVSAALVAVTVYVPAVLGAVYSPALVIVPPVVDHVTAVFDVPLTVAVNCCVPPTVSDAVLGEIETAVDTTALKLQTCSGPVASVPSS